MNITQRPFSGESDKQEMMALVRAFPNDYLHVGDMPYRFSSWAFDDPENVGQWVNAEGQLVGWAVMQTPFWSIDYAYHPEAADKNLPQQILAWVDERARQALNTPYGHPCWFVNVFTGQTDRQHDLEAVGFASQANVPKDPWSKVLMRRPAQLPVTTYPPRGNCLVRSLAGESEVEAYVELHRSVFESKSMTVEWRRRTLQQPDYIPDLDVVVAAPDGHLVAFCICWLDKSSGSAPTGRVEPLGCHQDFRRYALGRVALTEGLRPLQAHGAQNIYVETDSDRSTALALYESVGFEVIQDVLIYRKDYPSVP